MICPECGKRHGITADYLYNKDLKSDWKPRTYESDKRQLCFHCWDRTYTMLTNAGITNRYTGENICY